MKKFKIYFELYGKKMCTSLIAESKESAEAIIRTKIKIHKVEESEPTMDDISKEFEDMLINWGIK